MKNKIIGVIILVIVLVSFFIFKNENTNEKSDNIVNNEIAIEVNSDTFDKEVLQSDKKVLVDFYATWCGPCKTLSPILEEVAKENKNIKLVKIDVDQNKDLVSKYGINAMPTLIVFENGKDINRSVGLISKDRVIKVLNGEI